MALVQSGRSHFEYTTFLLAHFLGSPSCLNLWFTGNRLLLQNEHLWLRYRLWWLSMVSSDIIVFFLTLILVEKFFSRWLFGFYFGKNIRARMGLSAYLSVDWWPTSTWIVCLLQDIETAHTASSGSWRDNGRSLLRATRASKTRSLTFDSRRRFDTRIFENLWSLHIRIFEIFGFWRYCAWSFGGRDSSGGTWRPPHRTEIGFDRLLLFFKHSYPVRAFSRREVFLWIRDTAGLIL